MKTIAVDIDDTLNNFSEVLQNTIFTADEGYPVSPEKFPEYLERLRKEERDAGELLSTEFSFFRQIIHCRCYELAAARPDAVEFMRWLREDGWRIVICTQRDLRRTDESTRKWLNDNGIPFDYLFIALDKLGFCRAWDIAYLVDDHLFSVLHADKYAVDVFYPILPKHPQAEARRAKGFRHFNEVRQWITK